VGAASENGNVTGDLDITSSLTISGPGANLTVIDGGGFDRVLDIRGAVTVTITGVTITGGNDTEGSLTLTNVAVSDNVAVYGAGIEKNGTLTVISSTINNNVASYGPGGIDNYNGGALTVSNSTISTNSGGLGGAIGNSNYGPTMYLNNSTLSGNSAPYATLYAPAGTVFMKNTIIDGNGGGNCNFIGGSVLTSHPRQPCLAGQLRWADEDTRPLHRDGVAGRVLPDRSWQPGHRQDRPCRLHQ
jgi:hypothetical protein